MLETKDIEKTITDLFYPVLTPEPYEGDSEEMLSLGMEKHGNHDQSTHGSWANGKSAQSFDENTIYEKYSDFTPSSTEQYKIDFYIQRGADINKELRSGAIDADMIEKGLKEIDGLIDRAPSFPNHEVWRVASAGFTDGMKPGTIVQDLGYQSTTIADITKPENGVLLLSLATVTSGQKSLIKINTGSRGKGLYLPAVANDPVSAHEKEFLMPRGLKMRYKGVGETIKGTAVHEFEVIDE